MTTLANALVLACFLATCFRARWVALALLPAVALILARWTGLVDLSSASHPARWIVPLVGALLAPLAVIVEDRAERRHRKEWETRREAAIAALSFGWANLFPEYAPAFPRATVAALLIFGSDIVDLIALHPKIWEIPGVWAITPIQLVVCVSILVVLLAPERWMIKCLK